MMLDIFKGVIKVFRRHRVHTDSLVFRLHHRVTVAFLLLFCLIVGLNQYVRKPIVCSNASLPENLLNEYCWTHSTFTAEDSYRKKVGVEVPFPGLGPSRGARESKTKIQRYYQWVFICLFFQAVLFYIPRFLWKNWEGGKLRALRLDLDVGLLSADEKADKKRLLLNYLYEHRNTHTWWTYRYFLCEVLALVNVFSQMFLMNRFLDGEFWSYGSKVLDFLESDEEDRVDPMIYVFPRVAKCIFYRFGPSETVERHDSLCVLPLNVLNEKIYVFLWFWLVMLLVVTSGWILFRLVTIFSRRTRILIFGTRFGFISKNSVHKLVAHISVGDWFLLCMVGENADSVSFNEVINALAEKMDHHTYNALELRVV
ncbi:innexin shaking-B-like isoform X2 [Periplaneta americana]